MAFIIYPAVDNNELFGRLWDLMSEVNGGLMAPETIEKYFKEKYKVKLSLASSNSNTVIEFENEAAFVMFMLEWS